MTRYRVQRVQGFRSFGEPEDYAELDETRAAADSWAGKGYDCAISRASKVGPGEYAYTEIEYVQGIGTELDK